MKTKMVTGIGFALFSASMLLADPQRVAVVTAPVLPAGPKAEVVVLPLQEKK